jgi:hypothetical protein
MREQEEYRRENKKLGAAGKLVAVWFRSNDSRHSID